MIFQTILQLAIVTNVLAIICFHRGGSRSRAYSNSKRSRSSPPSSRYSTLDSVYHDEFVLACCGELPESDVEDIVSVHLVVFSFLMVFVFIIIGSLLHISLQDKRI